jgi:hypothetical protein
MSSVCLTYVNGEDQKRLEIREPDATLAQGPTFKNLQDGLETKNKWSPPLRENLARNGANRCGPFVMLANMPGSLNQFVQKPWQRMVAR